VVKITGKEIDAYRDAVAKEATEKERQRCLDIVKGLRSDSPTWSRDDDALIDGCSGPDLIDAIVDELARRIGTAS
jgi:hypothetical protein